MTGDQIAQISYLGLLGAAIAGFYLLQNRQNMGRTLQYAAIWGMIFIGAVAAAGLWQDISGKVMSRQQMIDGGTLEVPRARDGHYYVVMDVNDTPVRFVIDTGATDTVLTRADARRIGIDVDGLSYIGSANTANGIVRTAPVWLDDVTLEDWNDDGVRAVVNEGEMSGSLLGMSYLERYRVGFDGGLLTLER